MLCYKPTLILAIRAELRWKKGREKNKTKGQYQRRTLRAFHQYYVLRGVNRLHIKISHQ